MDSRFPIKRRYPAQRMEITQQLAYAATVRTKQRPQHGPRTAWEGNQ